MKSGIDVIEVRQEKKYKDNIIDVDFGWDENIDVEDIEEKPKKKKEEYMFDSLELCMFSFYHFMLGICTCIDGRVTVTTIAWLLSILCMALSVELHKRGY